MMPEMQALRTEYHRKICEQILFVDPNGVPNNADKHSDGSVHIARGLLKRLPFPLCSKRPSGQSSGRLFETITAEYIEKAFTALSHLRPGSWLFQVGKRIEDFEQYAHLATLSKVLSESKELRAALGDYLITPDIVVARMPVEDAEINAQAELVDDRIATRTPLRRRNSALPMLHASISCKWTIRSDRSQNARTEGLNLIRNRKGATPHIAIVTGEPYPHRIASLALGTGDIDCVYHFALEELREAAQETGNTALTDMMDILVGGKRLRDIGDLPFDLAA